MRLDPRITPFRDDLAADYLRGTVEAHAYAKGVAYTVNLASAPLFNHPNIYSGRDTELLRGEQFTVYEEKDGWSWGQASLDDYVGYIETDALSTDEFSATHKVSALRTFVYAKPNIKSPMVEALSFGTKIAVAEVDGDFTQSPNLGWIFTQHLSEVDLIDPDYLTTAVRFMGVPYLWGGRTSLGVDCSGLVQLCLQAAGIKAPRDSDLQAKGVGVEVDSNPATIQKGDLMFFPGHVGIMIDRSTILHANAWDMMVSPHPLNYVVAEIAKKERQPISCVRRLVELQPSTD